MRIHALHLLRYGHFDNLSLNFPQADCDLHLIVGDNEAGKSTVRQAIRDWLYGIPMRSTMAIDYEMKLLSIAGELSGANRRLSFLRRKGTKDTLRGHPIDLPLPDTELTSLLTGAPTADDFVRNFCLDHAGLLQGAQALVAADGEDRLSRLLFQSVAGIKGLDELLSQLDEEAGNLWGPAAKKTRAYDLGLAAQKAAIETMSSVKLSFNHYQTLEKQAAERKDAYEAASAEVLSVRTLLSRIERLIAISHSVDRLRAAEVERSELFGMPRLPAGAEARIEKAAELLAKARRSADSSRDELASADAELAGLNVRDDLVPLSSAIDTLVQDVGIVTQALHDLPIVERECGACLDTLRGLCMDLGWNCEPEAAAERLPRTPVQKASLVLLSSLKEAEDGVVVATRQAADAAAAVSSLQDQIDRVAGTDDGALLDKTIERLAQALKDAEAATPDSAQRDLQTKLARLPGWTQGAGALRGVTVPDAAACTAHDARIKTLETAESVARATAKNKSAVIDKTRAALSRAEAEVPKLARSELDAARAQRNQIWTGLRTGARGLAEAADEFDGSIREADRIADQRFDHAAQAGQIDSLARTLRVEIEEGRAAADEHAAAENAVSSERERWCLLTAPLGLDEPSGAVVSAWRLARDEVLAAEERLQTVLVEQLRADQSLSAVCADLLLLMPGGEGLSARLLLDKARLMLDGIKAAAQTRKTLLDQQRTAEKAQAAKDKATTDAIAVRDDVRQRWAALAIEMGMAADVEPALARQQVEHMGLVANELQTAGKLQLRITQMQSAIDSCRQLTADVAGQAGVAYAANRVIEVILTLKDLQAGNSSAAVRRDAASKRRDTAQRKLVEQERIMADAMQAIADLFKLTGTTELVALQDAAALSLKADQLDMAIEQHRAAILESSDGMALEPLLAEFDAQDRSTLAGERLRLTTERDDKTTVQQSCYAEWQSALKELTCLDGNDAAAVAEADEKLAIGQMQGAIDRYVAVKSGAIALKWALKKYREQNQGPLLAGAGELFSMITAGRYSGLEIDQDGSAPELKAVRADTKRRVPTSALSDGTRDALYLALRLGAIRFLLAGSADSVVIADDLFVDLDDKRAAAGFKALAELSKTTQVIYMSHHHHLADIAREAVSGMNVITLDGP